MNTKFWLVLSGFSAAALLAIAACTDTYAPVAQVGDAALKAPRLIEHAALVSCTPMAADSTTQVVGPLGGTIHVGPHALVIPPGALDSAVVIRATAPSDSVNRVHFEPEGLTFSRHASLLMSYANCSGIGVPLPRRVAFVSPGLEILELLPSADSLLSATVTGNVSHFSDYAVAW